ncbi:MAG: VOC family protein [Hyphomicrobiaceae bacterium]
MASAMVLDHIVVNTRHDLNIAEANFAALGFTLTPRGYHTLGSMNALAVFERDYLELIGVPVTRPVLRPEIVTAAMGLNGLVIKTDDADETYAHLKSIGVCNAPPNAFSRPLHLSDGSSHEVKFRTVSVRPDAFPAGRLYFCEHLTPELVWRREWQEHDNGALRFENVVFVTDGPSRTIDKLAAILKTHCNADDGDNLCVELAGEFNLRFLTQRKFENEFAHIIAAGAAAPELELPIEFGALTIKGSLSTELIERLRMDQHFCVCEQGDRTDVWVKSVRTLLSFVA